MQNSLEKVFRIAKKSLEKCRVFKKSLEKVSKYLQKSLEKVYLCSFIPIMWKEF